MYDSKLLAMFATMDQDTLVKASDYLKIHYAKSKTLLLFKYIKKHHNNLSHKNLSKRLVHKAIFTKEKKFDHLADKAVRAQMSILVSALEDFFVLRMLEKDQQSRQLLLARYYGSNNNYHLFEKVVQKEIKNLEENPRYDMEYQLDRWKWHHEWYFHPSTHKSEHTEALRSVILSMDQFFILGKLRYSADIFIVKKVISEEFIIELLEEVLALCDTQNFYHNPVIELYCYLFQIQLNTPDDEKFQKCVDLFKTNSERIDKTEQAFIINILTNYAGYCQNNGLIPYRKFALALYKLAIEKDLLLYQNSLKHTTFINIIIIGLLEYEFDWVHHFIAEFQKYLPEEEKTEYLQLTSAYWHYHHGLYTKNEKDFDRALVYLRDLSFSSIELDLRIRSLEIRILYEKTQENLLEDSAERFKKYLNRHKEIAGDIIKSYKLFISYVLKLKKLEPFKKTQSDQLQKLIKKIRNNESVALKHWLLEKAEALVN